MDKRNRESLKNYIGEPQYTDKKNKEVDLDRFLEATRFQRTINRVRQREFNLANLLETDPKKLTDQELIRVWAFGKRLFERLMRAHENARNPENPVKIISLKAIKPKLDTSLRDKVVSKAESHTNIVLRRLELIRREMNSRGVQNVSESSEP